MKAILVRKLTLRGAGRLSAGCRAGAAMGLPTPCGGVRMVR